MAALLVGRRRRCHAEDLLDRVADLVDLLQRGQEIDGSRRLPVVELLALQVHLEPAAVGRGEGDRRFPVVDRGQLSRHTDGYGEVPSDDAVDDLDVALAFGHFRPSLEMMSGMLTGPSASGNGVAKARKSAWPRPPTAMAGRP